MTNDAFLIVFEQEKKSDFSDEAGGALAWALASCRLGCQWGYHRVWIVRSPIAFVDVLFVDLILLFIMSR